MSFGTFRIFLRGLYFAANFITVFLFWGENDRRSLTLVVGSVEVVGRLGIVVSPRARVALLGPLAVRADGKPVELRAGRQRRLVSLLAIGAHR